MNNCFDFSTEMDGNCSNLVELLSYRASNQPAQKAYTFLKGGETEAGELNYQQLHLQAQTIAAYLQSLEAAGERALLLYQPGLEFVCAFFGCLYANVVAVPAYPPRRNQNLSRLQAIATDSQATIVLTTTALLDNLKERSREDLNLAELHWIATDGLSSDLATAWKRPKLTRDTLAFLQYTSGSTDNPKGVMVTHGNLFHNSAIIHQSFGHSTNSRGVIWLPPYHDMGLIGGVLQPLYGSFPVTLMSPVDFLQQPIRWLQAISRYQATTSGGPNFAYDLCLRKITPAQIETLDLSSWEVAFTGAEPVRAETIEEFVKTFASCGFRKEAFYPCYGMAETTLIVSGGLKTEAPVIRQIDSSALEQNRVVSSTDEWESRTIVGCGRTWLNQTLLIVNPDTCTRCSPEQIGEIWVSGDSIAQGYWNRTQETEQTFDAYLADTKEGPFLRTGDLGFVQDDELFITGRIKDIIIIRGQNHYPHDIELTVEKSHPALRPNSGAAFAVDFNGAERLVVVHEVERSHLRKLEVKQVIDSIKEAVVAQHGIDIYATVLVKTSSIPKTSSGKIRRQACRAAFLTGSLEVVEDWSESPQGKSNFIKLQSEVETMFQQLQSYKQM
jgi:acyl-CoA synthetase (AMP-forming)/AMP-acid ligase II